MNEFESGFKAGIICWIMVTMTCSIIKKMIDREFGPESSSETK